MSRKQIWVIVAIAFFIGAIGSIFFNRVLIPYAASIPGLGSLRKLQSNSPITITRREEVRLNEGVNLIELTKQAQTSTVSIYGTKDGKLLGNGIIITSDGVIFTTKEVLGSLTELTVILNDGSAYPALVKALDPKTPLVVISIPASNLSVAQFSDANLMQTAQRVFILGKTTQEFTRKFATGLVTKTTTNPTTTERIFNADVFEETVETDAHVNADYVGGPVVNLQGRVIGLVINPNGAILSAEAIDGGVRTYLANGKVTRPTYGFKYNNVTKSVAKVKSFSSGGALVTSVDEGSPASSAGVKAGDLIIEINGNKVEDSSLENLLISAGFSEAKLTVIRNNQKNELILKPGVK